MKNYKPENHGFLEEKCDSLPNGSSKLRKKWKQMTPKERYESLSWSVATSCAIESGEDPVKIYNKFMQKAKEIDWSLQEFAEI
jgi:predicted nuclease with TOPRIM domain